MEQSLNHTSAYPPPSDASELFAIQPYERPFDQNAVWIFGLFIFTLLVAGIILNTLTIAVIIKYKELRNLFVYFIFSLCISDLLSALISPLHWYRRTYGFDHWGMPEFFCKFYWAADLMTSFATALHIVVFGIFRLMSVASPHYFVTISNKSGIVCVVIIWIVSFVCGFIPYYIWFGARELDRYSNSPDARWPACTMNMEWYEQYKSFQIFGFSVFLYVPLTSVVIISVVTCLQVYASTISSVASKTSRRLIRKQKQAVLQLTLIVFSFIFGYLPYTVYEYWSVQYHENTRYNRRFDYYFGFTQYILLRFSECMNPVFYNLGSTKMRKQTRKFLHHIFGTYGGSRRMSKTSVMSCSESGQRLEGRSS